MIVFYTNLTLLGCYVDILIVSLLNSLLKLHLNLQLLYIAYLYYHLIYDIYRICF